MRPPSINFTESDIIIIFLKIIDYINWAKIRKNFGVLTFDVEVFFMVDSTSKCKINKNDQRKLSLEKRNLVLVEVFDLFYTVHI